MNTILLILVFVVIIVLCKDFFLIRDLIISKKYKKIYAVVLKQNEGAAGVVKDYMEEEKNPYLKAKANLLLMHLNLLDNVDDVDVINNIDFEAIFLDKGKYKKNFVNLNSDMMIWTLASMSRLKKQGHLDIIKEKMDKLDSTLSKHVEYNAFKAVYALLNGNEEESKFLNELVNGSYSGLTYDTQLIGVTKRIALAYIASLNKEINFEYTDELKTFAATMIGRNLLTDLEIYEIYK